MLLEECEKRILKKFHAHRRWKNELTSIRCAKIIKDRYTEITSKFGF
jgi:hypothetical protein